MPASAHKIHQRSPAAAAAGMLAQLAKTVAPGKFKHNQIALLAAIVQSSDDAIISKSLKDEVILTWNQGAERIFGYAPNEIIGKPISTIIPPERIHEDALILEKLKRGERVEHFETQRMRKDGSLVDVLVTVSPLKTAKGTVFGSTSIVRDITRRKLFQAALEREEQIQSLLKQVEEQKEALERSNTELQRFAYVAAHDLKEPLRTIVSYTNLLAEENKGKLSKDAEENMHFIVDAGKRMQQLINDLLAYSRVETQANPSVPTSCNDVFDAVVAGLHANIAETQAQITRDDLPTVLADPLQIEQLFLNLLGNALKFKGSAAPEVHVSAKPDGDNWEFCVKDNGIGLDMKFADRIFQMFQRLHGVGEYSGTGIGLAICKKIVERHKGRIWVESTPGQGTAFYFTLPAA